MAKKAAKGEELVIPMIKKENFKVKIVGLSPLLVHQFSAKSQTQMLEKQMKKAKTAREAKNPIADFVYTLHLMNGKDPEAIIKTLEDKDVKVGEDVSKYFKKIPVGFPASGFKKAAVGACRNVADAQMTMARGAFFILPDDGDLVEINYNKMVIQQNTVRLNGGSTDIRFRAALHDWSADLKITCNGNILSKSQVCNLIDISGFSVGVGDWRPEKNGTNGMFQIAR